MDSFNRYTAYNSASPALIQLECNVIKWMCRQVGYDPDKSFGTFFSGGSLSNWNAIVLARNEKFGEKDFFRGVVYVSDQVHFSIFKSLKLAGIPLSNVRRLPADEAFAFDTKLLESQIRTDLQNQMEPFLVIGTAGSTSTGTIDPLKKLAELCKQFNLWFHVDAAYGGYFFFSSV